MRIGHLQRNIIYPVIFFLLAFLFSCKKEKGNTIPATNALTTGTWYVSFMSDNYIDETNLFTDYTFVFNTNGELTAASPSGTTVGSWYADDNDYGDDEFRIALGYTKPLSKLSKRWYVRSLTSSKVELYDNYDTNVDELVLLKQ